MCSRSWMSWGRGRRSKARHRYCARQMALHVHQHSQAAAPPKHQAAHTRSTTPHTVLVRMLLALCTHVHHLSTQQHHAQMCKRSHS